MSTLVKTILLDTNTMYSKDNKVNITFGVSITILIPSDKSYFNKLNRKYLRLRN